MELKFKLNGLDVRWNVEPGESLLDALRSHGLKSLKKGCDNSACGVCSVLLDGHPILSCSYLAVRVEGHEVTTVEGIQKEAAAIAECFASEGADQCGYCNSSFALVIHAMSKELKDPTDEEIKKYMVGNLCRCTGYHSQLKAIKKYLGGLK